MSCEMEKTNHFRRNGFEICSTFYEDGGKYMYVTIGIQNGERKTNEVYDVTFSTFMKTLLNFIICYMESTKR